MYDPIRINYNHKFIFKCHSLFGLTLFICLIQEGTNYCGTTVLSVITANNQLIFKKERQKEVLS